ncbi:MAG: thiamine phosphate synthase [Dehalococcoidia bacterium]|nr:MAG: thiamine phosphate synthase [Dehalococcoidia bacterium]
MTYADGIGYFMNIINCNTLYLILSSEYINGRAVLDVAERALDAGIDMLQMREKSLSEEGLLGLGKKLLYLCRGKSVPFIVNDNPCIAKKLDADGVHLGQQDVKKYSLEYSRDMLGKDKIIGISTHCLQEFRTANCQDFDYIAFGPVFPTKTKNYHIGANDIEEVLSIACKPVMFIGGIDITNIDRIIEKGAKNIAVIRAITEAEDVQLAVKTLKKYIEGKK